MRIFAYSLRPYDELPCLEALSHELGFEYGWTADYPTPENAGLAAGADGVTIITGSSADTEETGTLIWTDPETNTTFFLEGALDRFDLRDMVTFMEETEPQFSSPVKGATFQSGTAGSGTD